MKFHDANQVVEELRRDTRLYLPALSKRRGFSSSRVEHLLNGLVRRMPESELYLEVGTLEGRTLESAAFGNIRKTLIGCDPCTKYDLSPGNFSDLNISFIQKSWQELFQAWNSKPHPHSTSNPIGCVFYDGDHSAAETAAFMTCVEEHLADEAVLVLDDWDRETVRDGAYRAGHCWRLLREMPCYGDGLTCPQQHFGYSFGVSVWGFRR